LLPFYYFYFYFYPLKMPPPGTCRPGRTAPPSFATPLDLHQAGSVGEGSDHLQLIK